MSRDPWAKLGAILQMIQPIVDGVLQQPPDPPRIQRRAARPALRIKDAEVLDIRNDPDDIEDV